MWLILSNFLKNQIVKKAISHFSLEKIKSMFEIASQVFFSNQDSRALPIKQN